MPVDILAYPRATKDTANGAAKRVDDDILSAT